MTHPSRHMMQIVSGTTHNIRIILKRNVATAPPSTPEASVAEDITEMLEMNEANEHRAAVASQM